MRLIKPHRHIEICKSFLKGKIEFKRNYFLLVFYKNLNAYVVKNTVDIL